MNLEIGASITTELAKVQLVVMTWKHFLLAFNSTNKGRVCVCFPGTLWLSFHITDAQYMVRENYRVYYSLWVVLFCLHITLSHYHYYINIFEGIELLKCLPDIYWMKDHWAVECVFKIKSNISMIFYSIYICVCVYSVFPILLWWSRECVFHLIFIIVIKWEVWIINHCLGLGHETMVHGVCLTTFLYVLLIYCDKDASKLYYFHLIGFLTDSNNDWYPNAKNAKEQLVPILLGFCIRINWVSGHVVQTHCVVWFGRLHM